MGVLRTMRPCALIRVSREAVTVIGRSDAAGRDGGPQRRFVGAQLRAGGGAACLEGVFDAVFQRVN